jgi:hypothetical protein
VILISMTWADHIRRGADKSFSFPISPTGALQHNQKNFSYIG